MKMTHRPTESSRQCSDSAQTVSRKISSEDGSTATASATEYGLSACRLSNSLAAIPGHHVRSLETIRFEIVHHILEPADLVCGIWMERDPLPDYEAGGRSMLTRIGNREIWTIPLTPRSFRTAPQNATVSKLDQRPLKDASPSFNGGLAIFRAVRPHICRLTVCLEFVSPAAGRPPQERLAAEVADIESTIDQFARSITSEVEEVSELAHTIFA